MQLGCHSAMKRSVVKNPSSYKRKSYGFFALLGMTK